MIKKVKQNVPWTSLNDLKIEEIVECFMQKKCNKTNKKDFRVEN